MTDSLTQLQDCFDQLLTRMFASIRYIDLHHPYLPIAGQSDQSPAINNTRIETNQSSQSTQQHPQTQSTDASQPNTEQPPQPEGETPPDDPELFKARLQELAQDLVVKEQQIEYLIDSLPGLGNSQISQEARVKELEKELREVEEERKRWAVVQEQLVERVEGKIAGIRRV